ncbi:phosphatidylinositol-3,5-bisphosphate 3-phosphatase MTMR2-like isoform X2 [Tubulanus polymorphus]|uniref:phosphatidylinositol-3,5-bisphosphate 3-phosphatase MTMR2-like isoform X2 n=2 Tax=Tubulanus polymorphus TaxID=672921 RepID=UPI003DA440F0
MTDFTSNITEIDHREIDQSNKVFNGDIAVMKDLVLLSGEEIQYTTCEPVTYIPSESTAIQGLLTITNYRLCFKSLCLDTLKNPVVDVPLGVIAKVENNENQIALFCKDIRRVKFIFDDENVLNTALSCLQKYAFPTANDLQFFAFAYSKTYKEDGWLIYDELEEYKRQGLPNDKWRITRTNNNYELCESYGKVLCVPMDSTDQDLKLAAEFRGRCRLPILSWIHPENGATICRSSHPLVGVENKRNDYDEKLIKKISETNRLNVYRIMDARPFQRAEANKTAKGGGYEREECYENSKLEFLNIQNIHVIADSVNKLCDLCLSEKDDSDWVIGLECTQWLHHIKKVLEGAVKVTNHIVNKSSVLIHCTAGWDRTPQLASLAMIMMDPYYRKIKGFEVLIEKEWLSTGHKYSTRLVHGEDNHNSADRSPMFVQWIDCIWQISQQFPGAFEFNEHFLITILDHLYSCLFGTFLFNSEMLRTKEEVKTRTVSLWSYINSDIERYVNPLYRQSGKHVIVPVASLSRIQFWSNYYVRWNPL